MRRIAIPLLLAAATALAATASVPETPAPPPRAAAVTGLDSGTAPLVKAAKRSGTTRKSTRKVITNKDLKKSPRPLPGSAAAAPVTVVDAGTPLPPGSVADGLYRDRKAAEARLLQASRRVTEVETELSRVEQSYYDENDLDYRDTVIRPRFDQTRRKLQDARRQLGEARAAAGASQRQP